MDKRKVAHELFPDGREVVIRTHSVMTDHGRQVTEHTVAFEGSVQGHFESIASAKAFIKTNKYIVASREAGLEVRVTRVVLRPIPFPEGW